MLRLCLLEAREIFAAQTWKIEGYDGSVKRQLCSMASYRQLDLNNDKRDVTVQLHMVLTLELSGTCQVLIWLQLFQLMFSRLVGLCKQSLNQLIVSLSPIF